MQSMLVGWLGDLTHKQSWGGVAMGGEAEAFYLPV